MKQAVGVPKSKRLRAAWVADGHQPHGGLDHHQLGEGIDEHDLAVAPEKCKRAPVAGQQQNLIAVAPTRWGSQIGF